MDIVHECAQVYDKYDANIFLILWYHRTIIILKSHAYFKRQVTNICHYLFYELFHETVTITKTLILDSCIKRESKLYILSTKLNTTLGVKEQIFIYILVRNNISTEHYISTSINGLSLVSILYLF